MRNCADMAVATSTATEGRGARAMMAHLSGLYPAGRSVIVPNRDIPIDRKSVGFTGTALPPVAFLEPTNA